MSIRRAVAAASVALIAILSAASAQAYDQIVVFGDSLSDNGNLAQKFGGAVPAAPYANGRFTNGAVAVEVMAQQLGLPLVDYAYGGATTGSANQFQAQNPLVANTGMLSQVNNYVAAGPADANALYVVWGGGNDFLAAIATGNFSNMNAVVTTAVTNLVTEVGTLYAAGARDFFIPLLPDLGTTFYGTSGAIPPALLSGLSASFNSALTTQMNNLEANSTGMNLSIYNTPAILSIVRNELSVTGGNVTDRCWTGDYAGGGASAPVCSAPDQYYLFDKVHPTALVHSVVGKDMAASVMAVPEPMTSGLMMVGLIFTGLAVRRNRAV
ncbi:MAG TPA: SGNH/GDSL hydrolase family protein [Aquabacterium sp.]|uniref:SGNH/GDSL hydrolase family protein n=1 Tax=Aquabacterium sp. TaxID=1872578 RepID=UPI002E300D4B|nr:SGNH/GDSL hydrolase family protein [Aquabacterium sp.]HEX5355266.1 SGNH/GDSL hydrolase family protein [Aquabacterium sp.]